MKALVCLVLSSLVLFSCKKEISEKPETPVLDVEKKNMGVISKRTATWCSPCGNYGFNAFENHINNFGNDAVYLAFKGSFVHLDGYQVSSEGQLLFDNINAHFSIGAGTPHFFYNFTGGSTSGIVASHNESDVVVNSNYEFELLNDKIKLKTTTKFFQDTEGEYYITPFLILDNQMGYQLGHDDTTHAVHKKFVAAIAKPTTLETAEPWSYRFATGQIRANHIVNLEFETPRKSSWSESDISFGIVIYKQQGDSLAFVNAFTK